MADDALLHEGVPLPIPQRFGQFGGRYFSALTAVKVYEGTYLLLQFLGFSFGVGPKVELYFNNFVVHFSSIDGWNRS